MFFQDVHFSGPFKHRMFSVEIMWVGLGQEV